MKGARRCDSDHKVYPVIVRPKLSGFFNPRPNRYQFLDFQLNVLALISCLQVGCGPIEVGLILADLNLEQAGTLERAYYRYIDCISVYICVAADMFIKRTLEDEVVETYKKELRKRKGRIMSQSKW